MPMSFSASGNLVSKPGSRGDGMARMLTGALLDSNFARHAFDTFIPLSVDSDARKHIIFDFFDLLAAVAARGKTNGMGGRKLSRMAGWWAFEHADEGKGFDGGYRSWAKYAVYPTLPPGAHVNITKGLPDRKSVV